VTRDCALHKDVLNSVAHDGRLHKDLLDSGAHDGRLHMDLLDSAVEDGCDLLRTKYGLIHKRACALRGHVLLHNDGHWVHRTTDLRSRVLPRT